jgi:hypothetical protein
VFLPLLNSPSINYVLHCSMMMDIFSGFHKVPNGNSPSINYVLHCSMMMGIFSGFHKVPNGNSPSINYVLHCDDDGYLLWVSQSSQRELTLHQLRTALLDDDGYLLWVSQSSQRSILSTPLLATLILFTTAIRSSGIQERSKHVVG